MYREMKRLWPVIPSFFPLRLNESFSSSGNARHESMASLNRERLACCAGVRGLGGMIQERMMVLPNLE